jgi:hypothetical protein
VATWNITLTLEKLAITNQMLLIPAYALLSPEKDARVEFVATFSPNIKEALEICQAWPKLTGAGAGAGTRLKLFWVSSA